MTTPTRLAQPDDLVIGLDLGTSGLKAVVLDAQGVVLAEAHAALTVSRPHPTWSEQAPAQWWAATEVAIESLRSTLPATQWQRVRGLAIAGQMHGAVLLDEQDRVLRPAILWNDGRSQPQCATLEARLPALRRITGNRAMAGFTAPKLMWVADQEPALRERVASVLLPKDWLVWQLTGCKSSEPSDAAGTLWLDVGTRRWSERMLDATGMPPSAMPVLHESAEPVAPLRPDIAARWGLSSQVHVMAGASDNAGAALGLGVVNPGDGLISLGTSGVLFVCTANAQANPERGVHTFCHARPNTWHQMAVLLSAASALSWWAGLCGVTEAELLQPLTPGVSPAQAPLFLPYLSGERTPHADPQACGAFIGLRAEHDRAALTYAVLEGVAFAFADGLAALQEAGARPERLLATGGGARSAVWLQLLANVLQRPLDQPQGAEIGPALGAARLALLGLGHRADAVLTRPAIAQSFEPQPDPSGWLTQRLQRFRAAYAPLRALC